MQLRTEESIARPPIPEEAAYELYGKCGGGKCEESIDEEQVQSIKTVVLELKYLSARKITY